MLQEQELSLMMEFEEQEIFRFKSDYDKSMMDYLSIESELSNKVGKITMFGLYIPFVFFLYSNFSFVTSSVLLGLSSLFTWPFAISLGQSKIGKMFGDVFFRKEMTGFYIKEKENIKNKELLKEKILSKETREFFAKLYLFLEFRVNQENDKVSAYNKQNPTVSLYIKVKKIIESYLESDEDYIVQKVLMNLKNVEQEIADEFKKSLGVNKFLFNNLIKNKEQKESKEDIKLKIRNAEKLFKKENKEKEINKYGL